MTFKKEPRGGKATFGHERPLGGERLFEKNITPTLERRGAGGQVTTQKGNNNELLIASMILTNSNKRAAWDRLTQKGLESERERLSKGGKPNQSPGKAGMVEDSKKKKK